MRARPCGPAVANQTWQGGRCDAYVRWARGDRLDRGHAALRAQCAGLLSSGRALRRRRCRCSDGAPHADGATCVGRDDQTAERVRNGQTPRLSLPRTMQSKRSISRGSFGSSGCRCAPTHTQHATMHAVAREADGTRREGHGGERPLRHLVCRVRCDALHESGRYEQISDR